MSVAWHLAITLLQNCAVLEAESGMISVLLLLASLLQLASLCEAVCH